METAEIDSTGMEMDMPAAEELEWLESNSLLPEFQEEEDEEVDVYEDYIEEEQDPKSTRSKGDSFSNVQGTHALKSETQRYIFDLPLSAGPTVLSPERQQTQRKRVRLEEKEGEGVKRIELDGDDEGGDDEDWLRYSPPKEAAAESDRQMSEENAEEAERFIYRFASEIDGDCMPVTGPGGDRVYAKLSSGLMDGGLKKFHREKSANGW